MRKGKPVSVILSLRNYEELLEWAEDTTGLAWLRKVRKKPLQYRALEEYLAERSHK